MRTSGFGGGQQPVGGGDPIYNGGSADMGQAREERVKKNDPNELLAQFLKDRCVCLGVCVCVCVI